MNIITTHRVVIAALTTAALIPVLVFLIVGISERSKKNPSDHPSGSSSYYESPLPSPPEATSEDPLESEVKDFLTDWVNAWDSKNLSRYMLHYSTEFNSRGMDYAGLKNYQRDIFNQFSYIDISIYDITYFQVSPNKLRINFIQKLKLNDYQDKGHVTMEIKKERGSWRIVSETWKSY